MTTDQAAESKSIGAPPGDPLIGKTLAGYEFTGLLGRGAFGAVYRAHHPRLKREVAVKYIQLESTQAALDTDREVDILATLDHPNVIRIYDAFTVEDYRLIIMEWIKGGSLRQWLNQLLAAGKRMELPVALEGLEKVASALEYVHKQNILHLDLKPENILLDPSEGDDIPRFVITDFGIAQFMASASGLTMFGGTPLYMSPEQYGFGTGKTDRRSDIYALGIILYELAVGTVPFNSPRLGELLNMHAFQAPPRPTSAVPGLPPALDGIVEKALAKDPGQRFQSASEIRKALRDVRFSLGSGGVRLTDVLDGDGAAYPSTRAAPVASPTRSAQPITPRPMTAEAPDASSAPPGSFGSFTINVRWPEGTQTSMTFQKQRVIIGRGQDVDLQLPEKAISRHHAEVMMNAEGDLFVTDLGSVNGTYLDSMRLSPQVSVVWKPNQQLTISGFTLWTGDSADSAAPESLRIRPATDEMRRLISAVQKQARPRVNMSLAPELISVEPGRPQYVQVNISAEDTPPATYTLRVTPSPGTDERWYTLPPSGKVVAPGDPKTFEIIVNPPETGVLGGQSYEVVVEAISDNPTIPVAVQILKVTVSRTMRFNIALKPTEVTHGRRRRADLMITNTGNYAETFVIQPEAPDRLSIHPKVPQIEVGPAQSKAVVLHFNPARDAARDGRLMYAVRVITPSGMSERINGSYVFRRRIRSGPSILALLVLALVAAVLIRWLVFQVDIPTQIAEYSRAIQAFVESVMTLVRGGR